MRKTCKQTNDKLQKRQSFLTGGEPRDKIEWTTKYGNIAISFQDFRWAFSDCLYADAKMQLYFDLCLSQVFIECPRTVQLVPTKQDPTLLSSADLIFHSSIAINR